MSNSEEVMPETGILTTKVKKGLSVTGKGAVGLSIPAIITAMITMLPGIYADIKEQRQEQAAGYSTLEPALFDLQEEADEFADWAYDLSIREEKQQRTIVQLRKRNWNLEQRLINIEMALEDRRIRVQPVPPDFEEEDFYEPDAMVSMIEEEPEPLRAPKKKARRHLPKNIGAAKAYQQQRVSADCAPNDPLCGFE